MNATAEILAPHVPADIRRFGTADLSRHGGWILKRLMPLYPDMPEAYIAGWMRGLIGNNEHLFLYQEHGVALAQVVSTPGLKPGKMIQERFVWVEDKTDKSQLECAADFYERFVEWGRGMNAERIICCENTDVPKSLIEAHTGRLFDTKISHARL